MNGQDRPAFSRRRFFGHLGTLLGAAGAVVMARTRSQETAVENNEEKAAAPSKRGYKMTEHVRKYYRKARF